MIGALRLAVSTFTVLPVPTGTVDRRTARGAMIAAPLVGALLGAVGGAVWLGSRAIGAPPFLAAAVTVAAWALLTRGLHLDGLADTADGLGSYGDPDRALSIMKAPDVGAFGVIAIVLALLVQTAAATAQPGGWAFLVAGAAGRLAAPLACRRGVPPARREGLGALVADTVPTWVVAVAAALVATAAVPAVPGRPWQGPVAVAAAALPAWLLVRHAVRRFGGITGDVIGAAIELATTVALAALALG